MSVHLFFSLNIYYILHWPRNSIQEIVRIFRGFLDEVFSVGVAGCRPPSFQGQSPIQGQSGFQAASGGLQPDPHQQPAQSPEPAGGYGNQAQIKEPMAIKARNAVDQSSL